MDEGLWGGEGIVKGYFESKPFTKKKILPRQWIPKLWWPHVERAIVYSEVLDKYMNIVITPRALRLIDEKFGLDYYLLETPEIDINSKLGLRLKREILVRLACPCGSAVHNCTPSGWPKAITAPTIRNGTST